jgi:hypothetical protein
MQGLYRKALGIPPTTAETSVMNAFFLHEPEVKADEKKWVAELKLFIAREITRPSIRPPAGQIGVPLGKKEDRNFDPTPQAAFEADELVSKLIGRRQRFIDALKDNYSTICPGHIHLGRRCDVPHDATYVGRHRDMWTWAMREDVGTLTSLTVAVLEVANTDISAQTGKTTKQPSPSLRNAPAGVSGPASFGPH